MADRPLRPATRRSLGGPLPHQQADRPRAHPEAADHFLPPSCGGERTSGISTGFPALSQSSGQVAHVLLTRSPVSTGSKLPVSSLDLHVLGAPPAFVLSQDQTLHRDRGRPSSPKRPRQTVIQERCTRNRQDPSCSSLRTSRQGVSVSVCMTGNQRAPPEGSDVDPHCLMLHCSVFKERLPLAHPKGDPGPGTRPKTLMPRSIVHLRKEAGDSAPAGDHAGNRSS